MRNYLIAFLMLLAAWSLFRLGETQRQLYALTTGLCKVDATQPRSFDCLRNARPYSSAWWAIYYGLFRN